jgi:hypothetical protein
MFFRRVHGEQGAKDELRIHPSWKQWRDSPIFVLMDKTDKTKQTERFSLSGEVQHLCDLRVTPSGRAQCA